jgi:hypothetical protein
MGKKKAGARGRVRKAIRAQNGKISSRRSCLELGRGTETAVTAWEVGH